MPLHKDGEKKKGVVSGTASHEGDKNAFYEILRGSVGARCLQVALTIRLFCCCRRRDHTRRQTSIQPHGFTTFGVTQLCLIRPLGSDRIMPTVALLHLAEGVI